MKKVLKIIGIILFVFIFIGAALFIYLSKRPAVSDDYIRKVQAGGDIEEKYLAMGPHDVSYWEQNVLHNVIKIGSFASIIA